MIKICVGYEVQTLNKATMKNLETLNEQVLKRIKDYQILKISSKIINTPYYINNIEKHIKYLMREAEIPEEKIEKVHQSYKNREIPFGWYRGKGTPGQIADATIQILENVGLSLRGATKEGISEFMKLYGLGIDCSGFVYNVLSYAFEKVDKLEKFNESLEWASKEQEKHNVFYAGAFVFAGKASRKISLNKLQPLDLLSIRNKENHSHIGMLVNQSGKLKLTQSSISTIPTGVTVTKFSIKDGRPIFGFKASLGSDWGKLYEGGRLEFRRLRCVDKKSRF